MYQWIIFAHVVSAFTFFMAHGVAIAVALRLSHERQTERLQVLLELSNLSRPASNISLIVLLLSGIAGGFIADWWRMGWIPKEEWDVGFRCRHPGVATVDCGWS